MSSTLLELNYNQNGLEFIYYAKIEITKEDGEKIIKNAEGYIRFNHKNIVEYASLGQIID